MIITEGIAAFEAGQASFVPGEPMEVPAQYSETTESRIGFVSGWEWARDCAVHFV